MQRIGTILFVAFVAGGALARADMSGLKERAMRNCPSTVPGAVTTIDNRPDGVLLTVTADKPKAQDEIRTRAQRQANVSKQPARGSLEHTGQGTGSGEFGYCPAMQQGTVVTVNDVPDGALIRVTARRKSDVQSLQKSARERLDELHQQR